MKKIILLIFVSVFCFFGISCNAAPDDGGNSKEDSVKKAVEIPADKIVVKKKTEGKVEEPKIIVYYFHGNARCYSCHKIEKYTREAVEEGFKSDKNGLQVVFKLVNIEEKENNHFIKDYKLSTKSVIVQSMDKNTSWKNLDKIWLLTGNKEKFIKYIREEVVGLLVIK
jgi:hypothetical protein